jgi:hypothetical protein
MKKCPNCGGLNSNSEFYCDYCSHELPKIKEFSIKEFLEDNHRLFTILGIFCALSYYLTNLASKTNAIEKNSIINQSQTLNIPIPTEIPQSTLLGISSDFFLQFGILLSYIIFAGIFAILLIEIFKHDKNLERSIFLYCFSFLCVVVLLYSISILQTIIPFFVFVSIIYSSGWIYSYIYEFLLKRLNNDISSHWMTLSILAILIAQFLIFLIALSLFIVIKDNITDIAILTFFVVLIFGLIMGTMFGSFIYMIRFINGILTYNRSSLFICIIGFLLVIIGVIIANCNFFNLFYLGVDVVLIGIMSIISVIFNHIKTKYSLKF